MLTDNFEAEARELLGSDGTWSTQSTRIASPRFLVYGVVVVAGAVGIVALQSLPPVTLVFRIGLAVFCFYYASTGYFGAVVAARGVADVARAARAKGILNPFHADGLGGLGFARDFADQASLFMLSGVAFLPMAVLVAQEAIGADTFNGYLACSLIVGMVVTWAIFSFFACISGRLAVGAAVFAVRQPILREVATRKQLLVSEALESPEWKACCAREDAAKGMRYALFSGLGGWQDLATLAGGAFALWKILEKAH